jgi:MFS family permease
MKRGEKGKSGLSPTVVRLGWVSFLQDISSEMLYPITPIFLTAVLGASGLSVGLIEGFAEAVSSLLKTYSGAWSDRISKRRPFISAGYALAAITKPWIGMASSWLDVLGARSVDRIGKGIRTAPRDAMISDSVGPELRGAAFGWHRLMDTLGATLGPLVALLFLTSDPESLRRIYFWSVIPGLLAVALTFTLRESRAPLLRPASAPAPHLRWKELDPRFRRFMIAWGCFAVVNSTDAFLLLKARGAGADLRQTILMYCLFNLVYALSSPWLGKLSDRFPRRFVLAGGLAVFAGVYLAFTLADRSWQFWPLFAFYGLYMAATDGVAKALVADLSPAGRKATGLGIFGTVSGIGAVVAGAVAGLLWDRVGPAAPFVYGALGAVISAGFLAFDRRN